MKFSDILALAKNGYSPKDIKDLMALSDPDEPEHQEQQEQQQQEQQQQEQQEQQQEPEQEQEPDKPDDKDAKIIDLEKKIAELQKLNTTKDLSDKKPKSDDDIFKELMKEFM